MLIGVGFFAKQPAVFFVGGGVAALLLRREPFRALAFGGAAATIISAGTIWLYVTTGGWFTYYVIEVPAHGVDREYLAQFFIRDLARGFSLTLATAALITSVARGSRKDAVFGCMLLAGLVASVTGRVHIGGYDNVLLSWSTFAIAALAIAASRVDEALAHSALARTAVGGLVTLQFGLWSYNPQAVYPPRGQRARTERFDARIRSLEASDGEVLVMGRGHISATRHFHIIGLIDVVRAERKLPVAIARAVTERRFADIVIDDAAGLQLVELADFDQQLFRLIAANYYVAERLEPEPPPVVGFSGHPSFVMRPRAETLDASDLALLERHYRVEVLLADSRMWAKLAKVTPRDGDRSVEDVAREMAGSR